MSNSKKVSPKVLLYTKSEAQKLIAEIDTFIKKIEKREGKKFDHSVGISVAVLASKDGTYPPYGHMSLGNGNPATLETCALDCIENVAQKEKKGRLQVISDLTMRMLRQI